MRQHAGARVYAGDLRGIADDPGRGPRQQSGARTDIQDRHLRLQAGTAQGEPTVPSTGTEPDDRLEAIVVAGGSIENAAYPGTAMSLAVVVLQQRGVRRLHGGACHWQRTRAA